MPEFDDCCTIDISPGDFIDACSSKEIKQLISILAEQNEIKQGDLFQKENEEITPRSYLDDEWYEICKTLLLSRLTISIEDENTIKEIYNKHK